MGLEGFSILWVLQNFQLMDIMSKSFYKEMNEMDSVGVGIVEMSYNWLFYGVVGKSVCRMWESCSLAFPCSVNGLFHDAIASYAHFHNAILIGLYNFQANVSFLLFLHLLYQSFF